jgi:hypothetical protein
LPVLLFGFAELLLLFGFAERGLERVKGIEPSSSAWKAVALPLSYTRLIQLPSQLITPASLLSILTSGSLLAFARRAFFSHHSRPLPEAAI